MEPEMPENPLKTGMLRQKTAISTHGRVALQRPGLLPEQQNR
jgi:hypothetical protein